jgi:NAD(P)-dependent dehydrogenase (short-subunit alcohol dehydrogenase family)
VTAKIDATQMLRAGLLEGMSFVLASAAPLEASPRDGRPPTAEVVAEACTALGARVHRCELVAGGSPEVDDALVDAAVAEAIARPGGVQALVVDVGGLFAAEARPRDGDAYGEPLVAALEAAWRVTRAVANAAFIDPGAEGAGPGGRIVYVAPPTAADGARAKPELSGAHADAARAGLENLARTLSIEWARYAITPVAIAPGPDGSADEVAALVAYLASPAGSYFSGCLLDLRGSSAGPALL